MMTQYTGLDAASGSATSGRYTFSYGCKGSMNSSDFNKLFLDVTAKLNKLAEAPTFKDLVMKFTYQILKSRDVPRQECCYNLAGGDYVYNTVGLAKFSVNGHSLKEVVAEGQDTSKKSTFASYYSSYKRLDASIKEHINFYLHIAAKENKAPCPIGFPMFPSWPLNEDFAKYHLLFFKPHNGEDAESELKGGHTTYVDALLEFMYTKHYPKLFLQDIIKAKNSYKYHKSEEQAFASNADNHASPSDNRNNDVYDALANESDANGYDGEGGWNDADLRENNFTDFPAPNLDYDWSLKRKENAEAFLTSYTKAYYKEANNATDTGFMLQEPDKYKPENAKGFAQQFIIGSFLVLWKHWLAYFDQHSGQSNVDNPQPAPPSLFMYVQGNPGTGKSFVIGTVRNVVISISQSMSRCLTCAPTGCAASLINGKTVTRAAKMPTGKKLKSRVDSKLPSTVEQVKVFVSLCQSFGC
jgi:hypothetical protein